MDLREKLLKQKAILKTEESEVGGAKVLLCELTAGKRIELLKLAKNDVIDLGKLYPSLIVYGLRDPETKELIFKDGDEADVLELLGWATLEKVANRISVMTGILDDKAIVEAEKK